MLLIAEVRLPIELGGRTYQMCFNCNSMVAYEQATGKFFLSTVADLFDAMFPDGVKPGERTENARTEKNPLAIVRKVSMVDLRALLWSTLHEYDNHDNPVWPLTINQVGRYLQLKDVVPVFNLFLRGQSGNNPTRDEMGESQAEVGSTNPSGQPPITAETGGEPGINLPADALA